MTPSPECLPRSAKSSRPGQVSLGQSDSIFYGARLNLLQEADCGGGLIPSLQFRLRDELTPNRFAPFLNRLGNARRLYMQMKRILGPIVKVSAVRSAVQRPGLERMVRRELLSGCEREFFCSLWLTFAE